jgi:hypothetical protein
VDCRRMVVVAETTLSLSFRPVPICSDFISTRDFIENPSPSSCPRRDQKFAISPQ